MTTSKRASYFIKRWLAVWVEYVMFFPIYGGLACLLLPESEWNIWWFLWFPLMALAGAVWRLFIPWKRERLWLVAIGFLLGIGLIAGITQSWLTWQEAVLGLVLYFLFIRGIQAMSRPRVMIERHWQFTGIGLTLVVYAASHYVDDIEVLKGYLSITGMIALLILFFDSNHQQLVRANRALKGSEGQVPKSIASFNRRYLVWFIVGVVVIVLLLFSSVMDRVTQLLHDWLSMILKPGETGEPALPPSSTGNPNDLLAGLGEAKEPSAFAKLLERIMIGAGWLLVIALTAWVLYLLFKKMIKTWMPGLWKKLTRWLKRQEGGTISQGYVDEETDLFQWERLRHRMTEPFSKVIERISRRSTRIEDFATNKERIRFLYRAQVKRAVKDGYERHEYLTPSETLHSIASERRGEEQNSLSQLASVYNDVRYGDKDVSDEDVKKLRRQLDR